MILGAVQMVVCDNISLNVSRVLSFMEKAKRKNVSFLCFPEICLANDPEAVPSMGRHLKTVCSAARTMSINVVLGTYVREGGVLRNQIVCINREGIIVHRYNKRNPYMTEKAYVVPGRKNTLFSFDDVPCAVINCWDYAFPEHLRILARKGAKVIFCPSYLMSFPLTRDVLIRMPQVRAFDTMAYFIMVDAFTDETFCKSRICHPLKQLAYIHNKEGLITASLDLAEIDRLREQFPNL